MDWTSLFQNAQPEQPICTKAQTYRRSWESACRPVQVTCNDGHDYVVKGSQVGRSAFNDQVVGRIAGLLGAPVADVSIVEIDPGLVHINPEMSHISPGLAHGSRFVADCTDGFWFQYIDVPENRPRFAVLSVLYGWMVGAEKQFFYGTQPPNLVYSFDHDAFFPNGPGWNVTHLENAPFADVDGVILEQCGLRHRELTTACECLQLMTPEIIASAIGPVPEEWGKVSIEDRIALDGYLWERCEEMRN